VNDACLESADTIIVVPCYNEAARLEQDRFAQFAEQCGEVGFVLVNDGSTDDTLDCLQSLSERSPKQFFVLDLENNRGKAEAVRQGMLAAFQQPARFVGYWDADLATPLDEIPIFRDVLASTPQCEVVLGARVALLGRSIQRSRLRHYAGRVIATLAAESLELTVYDTQCGAKLFRSSPATRAIFAEPFLSNWMFDVEILARLIRDRRGTGLPPAEEVVIEQPLRRWRDVAGSRVKPSDFLRAMFEIYRIRRTYLRDPKGKTTLQRMSASAAGQQSPAEKSSAN